MSINGSLRDRILAVVRAFAYRLQAAAGCLLLVAAVAIVEPATAKLLEDLYSAEVEIQSQSRDQRETAIANAFNRVLIKLTGRPQILDDEAIQQARRSVNDYLVQYGYGSNNGQQTLTATFDGQKLRDLLADNQLPYWGSRRPELLAWIGHEGDRGRRQLINSSSESIFTQQLRFYARQSGVPLQLPLMDLTDAQNINVTDVWGRFITPIKRASARYYPDGILVAKITENTMATEPNQRVRLDWYVEVDEQRLSGEVTAASEDFLAEPFINQLQQTLAQNYGIVRSDEQQIETLSFAVAGLKEWQDVLELERFLNSIDSVHSVNLKHYSTEKSEFQVSVRGNADHLLQSIQLDGRLQSEAVSPFIAPEDKPNAVYRWLD